MGSLAWVRKISNHLKELDQIPLFGKTPLIEWEPLASLLASRFKVKNLSLKVEGESWRTPENIKEGLGDSVLTVPFQIGPLDGHGCWMMSQEDVEQLTAWCLSGKSSGKGLRSEALTEGFYRFLLLQAVDALSSSAPFNDLSIVMSELASVPDSDHFCIDVKIRLERRSVWGRIGIEPRLLQSWRTHFSQLDLQLPLPKVVQSLELTSGLAVGKVMLSREEWGDLEPGDFVVLDRGSYHPGKHTGTAYWMLGQLPLFQVKIKQNKIQILDYANIYEEPTEKTMVREHSDSSFDGEAEALRPADPEASVSLQTVPVTVTVEIARLKLTLEKVLQLAPGNLLELPIHPDQPVHLTVNGQVVGQAELVQLGEVLGIRVLSLG